MWQALDRPRGRPLLRFCIAKLSIGSWIEHRQRHRKSSDRVTKMTQGIAPVRQGRKAHFRGHKTFEPGVSRAGSWPVKGCRQNRVYLGLVAKNFLYDCSRELFVSNSVAFVDHVVDTREVNLRQFSQPGSEMQGVRWRTPGIGDSLDLFASPQRLSDGAEKVSPAGTKNESAADDHGARIREL